MIMSYSTGLTLSQSGFGVGLPKIRRIILSLALPRIRTINRTSNKQNTLAAFISSFRCGFGMSSPILTAAAAVEISYSLMLFFTPRQCTQIKML
ncbi:hypothetical protein TSAR_007766 [Trichomalopsis sarcophagae]|uniref:Uncharacterized protein n=1 Tax=Trichomalopsis sarcophagae TaxID=543379 RepID=A0A232F7S6_9HYME|nr:hypothetical protein TSAR_007766 [Trichomalopsis sarcophagae]